MGDAASVLAVGDPVDGPGTTAVAPAPAPTVESSTGDGHPRSVVADPATVGRGGPRTRAVRRHLSDPLFRNAYALVGSTALTTGLGLVYWVVAARIYDPADVGRGSAVISVMILLAGLAQLNLMPALTRFLPRAGAASAALVGRSYLAAGAVSLVTSAAFVASVAGWFPDSAVGELLDGGWAMAALFVVSVVSWVFFTLQDAVLTGLRRALWVPVDNTAYGIAKLVALVALASALPGLGVFVSWTIPALASVLVVTVLVFTRAIPRHRDETRHLARPVDTRHVLRFVAGDYAGSLFELVAIRLLPVFVVAGAGAEAAGYFYVVWVLGTALELVVMNFGASLTVEGSISMDRLASMTTSVIRRSSLLLGPAVVVLVLGAGVVLSIFGPGYRQHGTALLQLLGLALVPRVVILLSLSIARVRGRIVALVVIQAAFAALVVASALALVGPMGIAGVGLGYLVASVVVGAALTPSLVRFLRGRESSPS